MPSTEEYIAAIRDRKKSREAISVDFSSLPQEVDGAAIAKELSDGLPEEYGTAVSERLSEKTKVKLNYAEIPGPEEEEGGLVSPLTAAKESLERVHSGIVETAGQVAKPLAAPIDAAIKKADISVAGEIPMFAQEIASSAVGGLVEEQVGHVLSDVPGPVKRYAKDFAAGAVGLGSGTGGALRAIGFENVGGMIAKSSQETAKNLLPPDPNLVDAVAQGLGSMSAFMVPGMGISNSAVAVATVAPRLAAFLGVATSSVLEAGVEAGDVYNDVFSKTGDQGQALTAAGRTFWANVPLIHFTNKLGWAGDQAHIAARALESSMTEGFQEGSQQVISNFSSNDPIMAGVIESAFVGGITGGLGGAAAHGVMKPSAPAEKPSEGQPPVLPTPEEGIKPSTEEVVSVPEKHLAESVQPTGKPLASQESSQAEPSPELLKTVYDSVGSLVSDRIRQDPRFVKAHTEAAAGMESTAKLLGIEPTAENYKKVWDYNHEEPKKIGSELGKKYKSEAEAKQDPLYTKAAQLAKDHLAMLKFGIVAKESDGDTALTQWFGKAAELAAKEAPKGNDAVQSAVEQLVSAGYSEKVAKTLSTVFEGFRVLGERAKINPQELFNRYGIEITKQEGEGGQVLKQEADRAVVETKAFKKWFGKSKLSDADGVPMVLYHGTTGDFTTFEKSRANPESDFGAGFYFTNTREDVAANYAGEGPDLQNKIELRSEQLWDEDRLGKNKPELKYGTPEYVAEREKFKAMARAELSQHGGATVPVYIKIEKPFVVGGEEETRLEGEFEYEDNDPEKDIIGEKGLIFDFIAALKDESEKYDEGSIDGLVEKLLENGTDGVSASKLYEIAANDEHFGYYTDDNGKFVSKEILRAALEKIGFDGIVDRTVDSKFGSQRRIGKSMEGVSEDTVHYIAFKPEQIKSAIGNRGTFDPKSPNILLQKSKGGGARGQIRIGPDRKFSIELLEGADLSTFLHETGHLYLEILGDLAGTESSVQIKDDYSAILSWLGASAREKITIDQHEKFARGFEAYLMEGKAPSSKLRVAFENFKKWLSAIYKQISAMDVELTAEVRGVFDRILATDEEIKTQLLAAEKALARARKRKNEADSQAPPEIPQDAIPAAQAAVGKAQDDLNKVRQQSEPLKSQKGKPDTVPTIQGVKRSILEAFSKDAGSMEDLSPRTKLKPVKLEKYIKAGLLKEDFTPSPLALKAIPELERVQNLLRTGYVDNIALVQPKRITIKSLLQDIGQNRPQLLGSMKDGIITDGRILFKMTPEDEQTAAVFKKLGEQWQGPNTEPLIKLSEKATDRVSGILGATESGRPSYLIQTEAGRQLIVGADYYEFFKARYPEARFFVQHDRAAVRVESHGEFVGLLMPIRGAVEPRIYNSETGEEIQKPLPKGRAEVDAKMFEADQVRNQLKTAELAYKATEDEIKKLDETPGEKKSALIAKITQLQIENQKRSEEMDGLRKQISVIEEQAASLRESYGIEDIPASGLVKKRPRGYKGGGKGASSGDFAMDTPVELGGMEHIKPFRMPELVRLAYELMGQVPEVGGLRTYNGYFKGGGSGEIRLNPVIFKKPEQAAKTLAHEIGHLIDYLPNNTLKRGNLLGSLQSLHSYLKNTFGVLDVTNKDLRDELMAVTMYWRPYDPESSSASYNSYRKSARELYADAISVLFNTPGTLERMAPKFYKQFFDGLENKPNVKLKFFELQAFLNQPEISIQESRHLDRQAMYLTAEDLWKKKRGEKETRDNRYGEWIKQLVVEKHQKIIGEVEAAASNGVSLDPSKDPRYILEEMSLADNANHAFLEEVDSKVVRLMNDSEVSHLDMGDYLYLSRVANGDRQAFANPKGYNPEEAGKALGFMKDRLGQERFSKLESAASNFREIVFKLSEQAVEVGAYNRKVFEDKIVPNKGTYAVFAVQEHLEDYITAGVKEQVGTLKDIGNPFTATVMKMIALNRLIAKQKGANSIRDFLVPRGEATVAEVVARGDKLAQFRNKKGFGIIEMLEDGKPTAYYVDPYIAEAFARKPAGTFDLAVKVLDSVFNGLFRPLYITFNIGFQLFSNPIRDFSRTRRNVYALVKNSGYAGTVKSLLVGYATGLGAAGRRAAGIQDDLVSEMIANKSLDITFTDYTFDPDTDQYTAVLRKMGMEPPKNGGILSRASKSKILVPFVSLLEGIRFIGNTFESVSKIAGYKVLKADSLKTLDKAIAAEEDPKAKERLQKERVLLTKGQGEYSHALTYNTRNYVGTPNWRRKGTITRISNTFFPFSNIMIQGFRSDLAIAANPNTRTGFAFDMVLTQVMPKLLMFLAALGGAGDELEEFFGKVSEYDKSNYIVLPIGFEEGKDGRKKAVYARIPHDETGRLIAAVFWKIGNALRGDPAALQQIIDFGAGQMPKLAPPLTIGATWVAYLSGKNPYDDFRGRPLMSDKVYRAGGMHSLKKMVEWTMNSMGLSSFTTHDDATKSKAESILQVTPLLNRIFKISDYGEKEESMKKIAEKQAEDARRSLDRGEAAKQFTYDRYILSQKKAADVISSDELLRLAKLNKYLPVYNAYSKAIRRARDKGNVDEAQKYEDKLESILSKAQ